METVLLSANVNNIEACVEMAIEYGLGIEVMAFAFPHVLDVNWKENVQQYRKYLRDVPGPITLHGPFMDMASGSPDPRINAVCMTRYQHAVHIASELNAHRIVFHANFISAIHSQAYREDWHRRNVDFWGKIADYAQVKGVPLAVENMWEFDPDIIIDVLEEVNHPYLRACLDVGHAHLYGPDYTFEQWFTRYEPFTIHAHMNNTHGKLDSHNAFPDGEIDYTEVLNRFRQMETLPTMVLEMYEVDAMAQSLPYFQLEDVTA
ncbi:MAG: sugar phosphate isomerase/epimerase family protein [Chloroflexota bacterium]